MWAMVAAFACLVVAVWHGVLAGVVYQVILEGMGDAMGYLLLAMCVLVSSAAFLSAMYIVARAVGT